MVGSVSLSGRQPCFKGPFLTTDKKVARAKKIDMTPPLVDVDYSCLYLIIISTTTVAQQRRERKGNASEMPALRVSAILLHCDKS